MSEPLTAEELDSVSLFDNDAELYLVPARTWQKALFVAEEAQRLREEVEAMQKADQDNATLAQMHEAEAQRLRAAIQRHRDDPWFSNSELWEALK